MILDQGGVTINKVKVDDEHAVLSEEHLLAGGAVVIRRGKKTLVGAIVR